MTKTMSHRFPSALALACLGVMLLTACATDQPTGDAPAERTPWAPTPADPEPRPDDGLLGDAELQAIVDRQVAGDVYGLLDDLRAERPEVRARAAFALASTDAVEASDALLTALRDEDAAVRRDAAFALGRIADPGVVPDLVSALESERDAAVRLRLVEALGMLPARASADALLAAELRGAEVAERARALSRLGGPGGLVHEPLRDRLIEDITHEDPTVREAAAYFFRTQNSLGQWISRSLYLRLALDEYEKDDPAAMHLVKGLGLVQDVLNLSRLRDWAVTARDWRTRADATSGLDPMSASGPILLDALDDPAPNVAVAAAERLSDDAGGVALAARATSWIAAHPDRLGVVGPLLSALARADQPEAIVSWVEAITPGDDDRWQVALAVIAYMPGEDALRLLTRALADPSRPTAVRAMEALANRWERDREVPETHETYFAIFSDAADHPVTTVARLARELLSAPELRDRARAESVPTAPPAGEASSGDTGGFEVAASIDWDYLARLGESPRLTLDTEKGTIVVRMVPSEAPLTVQTVARLAEQGAYDGVAFHRVVPNFLVQGGDHAAGDGTGDPGFTTPVEQTLIPFRRGVMGMAHRGSRDSQSSQFMILHSAQLELDGDFTAFGWVEEGLDVVDRIELFDAVRTATVTPG